MSQQKSGLLFTLISKDNQQINVSRDIIDHLELIPRKNSQSVRANVNAIYLHQIIAILNGETEILNTLNRDDICNLLNAIDILDLPILEEFVLNKIKSVILHN